MITKEKTITAEYLVKQRAEIIAHGTFKERFALINYYCTKVEFYLDTECPITLADKNAAIQAVYNDDNADNAILLYKWLCANQAIIPTAKRLDTIVAKQMSNKLRIMIFIETQRLIVGQLAIRKVMDKIGIPKEHIQELYDAVKDFRKKTLRERADLSDEERLLAVGKDIETLSAAMYKTVKNIKFMIDGIRAYYTESELPLPYYFNTITSDAHNLSGDGKETLYDIDADGQVRVKKVDLIPNYDKLRVTTEAKKVTQIMYKTVEKLMKENAE